MKPDPQTPCQILVKASGKSHKQAAIHLYNPRPRCYYYGNQLHAGSVCYSQVSPKWPGWELRDGTLDDVTCKKCRRWADGARRRELAFITMLLGVPLRVPPASVMACKRERIEEVYAKWERFTGAAHPGQGVK